MIAHSLGGLLAASYALQHPKRVSSLVLLESLGTSSKELVDKLAEESIETASWTHIMSIIGVIRGLTFYDVILLLISTYSWTA